MTALPVATSADPHIRRSAFHPWPIITTFLKYFFCFTHKPHDLVTYCWAARLDSGWPYPQWSICKFFLATALNFTTKLTVLLF